MSRETYETYSAEPEKIDLIAFLAEYFQAFRKFFLGVLILVILMGGGSFLTAKLRYQPMYEAYTSFVVGSNRAVGYSYYDNVTAQQLGKTFPYIVTSGVLKDVVARDLQVGAVTSQIEASVMENTNLFTIRVKDSSPDTAYRVLQSVITNYPEVAEYIIGATTLTVVDDSGVPVSPINSQDAVYAGLIGAALNKNLSKRLLGHTAPLRTALLPKSSGEMWSCSAAGTIITKISVKSKRKSVDFAQP